MPQLMSDELREALVSQWAHEIYNSHLYLYVSAYLKNKGLDNLAKFFEGHWEEEQSHAKIILDLLTDLNLDFDAPMIEPCKMYFNSLVDVANIYMEREISTTTSLDEIKNMAIEESCPVVEESMRKMISIQQEEYKEATEFKDKVDIIGQDWKFALLWDASLG